MHYDSRLLGHDKLDTTARYTRVATGMISGIESLLDLLAHCYGCSLRTLNAFTGRWKPLSSSSPTGSSSANVLTSDHTFASIRIWPSFAPSKAAPRD